MASTIPTQPSIPSADSTTSISDEATFEKETKEDRCDHLEAASQDLLVQETTKLRDAMYHSSEKETLDASMAPNENELPQQVTALTSDMTHENISSSASFPQESISEAEHPENSTTSILAKPMINPSPPRFEPDDKSVIYKGTCLAEQNEEHKKEDTKQPFKRHPSTALVTSQSPRRPKDPPRQGGKLAEKHFVPTNRGRVVSLDRGHEALEMKNGQPLSECSLTNDNHHHHAISEKRPEDFPDDESSGADTSDGESSYFAKHLPSPKSFRRYSLGSAPAHASYYQNQSNRESDASLSLSDDSDEDMRKPRGEPSLSLLPTTKHVASAEVPLFPLPRITRMHSYGSLVSSASSDEGRDSGLPIAGYDRRKANSTGLSPGNSSTSDDSTGTTSDNPSVRDELRSVAAPLTAGMPAYHNETPSGRKSPVLGGGGQAVSATGRFFAPFTSPGNPQPSPPTILPGYPPPPGMPHPQPQAVMSEQLAAWMESGNVAANLVQNPSRWTGYGSMMAAPVPSLQGPYSRRENRHNSDNMPTHVASAIKGNLFQSQGPSTFLETQGPINTAAAFDRAHSWEEDEIENKGSGQNAVAPPRAAGGSEEETAEEGTFKVYWQRWLMLMYMSLLNLLSDWTCYSVAPIAMLTQEAFGKIDPEQLVVIFLGANVVSTACEPIILARLGLRGTVLFGSLLLMIGSIIKSGGIPPIWGGQLVKGRGEWRIELGFFLVGLSQPLYQCTPALLSASWFPGHERTMATGVALNANQLGIGFAFIFGTLLVARSDDILSYFGLLSILSTLTFLGTFLQFDDAPPTPPSGTAKVMRGTVNLPSVGSLFNSVRSFSTRRGFDPHDEDVPNKIENQSQYRQPEGHEKHGSGASSRRESSAGRKSGRSRKTANKVTPPQLIRKTSSGLSRSSGGQSRRSGQMRTTQTANTDSGFQAPFPGLGSPPSPGHSGKTRDVSQFTSELGSQAARFGFNAPSPMMSGRVGPRGPVIEHPAEDQPSSFEESNTDDRVHQESQLQYSLESRFMTNPYPTSPGSVPIGHYYSHYNYAYWDPRYQNPAYYQYQGYYFNPHQDSSYQLYAQPFHPARYSINSAPAELPVSDIEDGAEPVVTVTPHHLDINIRDDQVLLSARACLSRPGFVHALVAFTVSGIVINTLSTFMDYLVRLNGASREYVGIVGGSFQFVIMISSLIIGTWTDKTRAYYSVTIAMLVMGAFGLAECGVSLNANRGGDVRWILVVVAALVGPLQPVSTELGVDVAYPLSENSVLVIQQLFSNLLSAMFIPIFKSLKDVGTVAVIDQEDTEERPKYTFSFYLLIVLHTAATVFFATFNGRYLRYEHELEKKAREEQRKHDHSTTAFQPVWDYRLNTPRVGTEEQPLVVGTEQQPYVVGTE
jgi:hypothetical protein